jgi:hypothetical protein
VKGIDKKYFNNPKGYIPKGFYCYSDSYICPFWDKDKTRESQNNGYCHYMKRGDWQQEHTSLLWDMCKECDINDYVEGID